MSDFETLMFDPMPPLVVEGIAACSRLHKLWEAPDREKALAEIAPHVAASPRGAATARSAPTSWAPWRLRRRCRPP